MESVAAKYPPERAPDTPREFDLYVMDVSYFSGKLESYFRYSECSYHRLEPTLRQLAGLKESHSGTAQVPQVYAHRKKLWLRDTTAIMEWMEENKSEERFEKLERLGKLKPGEMSSKKMQGALVIELERLRKLKKLKAALRKMENPDEGVELEESIQMEERLEELRKLKTLEESSREMESLEGAELKLLTELKNSVESSPELENLDVIELEKSGESKKLKKIETWSQKTANPNVGDELKHLEAPKTSKTCENLSANFIKLEKKIAKMVRREHLRNLKNANPAELDSHVLPQCETQSFMSFLFEDLADEYLWRPAMYYRWGPELDASNLSERFTFEFGKDVKHVPKWNYLVQWILRYRQQLFSVFSEDIYTPEQIRAVENLYLQTIDALELILTKQDFLLYENSPSLIDFGFMGPFFRHFSSDPTPRKILQQRGPKTYAWVARVWAATPPVASGKAVRAPPIHEIPDSWALLFPILKDYLIYLLANSLAYKEGRTEFDFLFNNVKSTIPVVESRVWCRGKLQSRFKDLNEIDAMICKEILQKHGCFELLFTSDTDFDEGVAPPELGVEPPFCVENPVRAGGFFAKWDTETAKWPRWPIFERWMIGIVLYEKAFEFFVPLVLAVIYFNFL